MIEDAYRPLRRATGSRRSGACATCRRSTATSRSSTAAACARSRDSSTATRIPRGAATGSTSSRSAPPARATRSCTRPAAASSRPSARRVRSAPDGLHDRVERHAAWMLAHGTTTWEGKSGYGLDRETELASLRAVRAAGGSPTWLGAHAVPPEHRPTPTRTSTSRSPRCCRRRPRLADAADVFLERGAFDARPGAPLSPGVPRRRARAAAARRPVHGERRGPAGGRARRALGRPPRGDG